jgi:hypothetical protein
MSETNTRASTDETAGSGTSTKAASPGEAPFHRPRLPASELGALERLTMAVIRLSAWKSDPAARDDGRSYVRSWKGYSFWALGRLADAGLIRTKADYKTVLLTDEGRAFSEASLTKLGVPAGPLEIRGMPKRKAGTT